MKLTNTIIFIIVGAIILACVLPGIIRSDDQPSEAEQTTVADVEVSIPEDIPEPAETTDGLIITPPESNETTEKEETTDPETTDTAETTTAEIPKVEAVTEEEVTDKIPETE